MLCGCKNDFPPPELGQLLLPGDWNILLRGSDPYIRDWIIKRVCDVATSKNCETEGCPVGKCELDKEKSTRSCVCNAEGLTDDCKVKQRRRKNVKMLKPNLT
ncbi:hypothetical protein V5799_011334 [Amblyomma americanum]|uniref:Uncharacterized protein n=1 Tax=Amblyomma americanum TaxID=6943 RepID=A0AAQ4EHC0_AMBAM